jgi:hypothetical protein
MKHTIRTAFGDSTDSYGGEAWTMPLPPQGIYQGNGVGPTAWLIISSNLLNIMRQLGYVAFYKTALSGDTLEIAGFLYMDDTDLTQSQMPTVTTAEEVLEKIQEGLNTWEGLVKASEGALSNGKSCWWYVDFSFDHKGDWRYKKMEELEGEPIAINIDGTRKTLKRLEVNESFETLGVQLNPIGDDTAVFNDMQKWAKNWSQQIKKSTLKDHEAHTARNVTIRKKLEYPLVAVTLTRKQCDKVMSTLLTTSLPKAGYNCNFLRKALHGPPSLMGRGVLHIYATTVAKHVQEMMIEAPHNSPSGQLIRTSIEQAKLELGLEGRLFDHDFKAVGHLIIECWIKSVWKESTEYGLRIIKQTVSLKPECEGDKMLMEAFMHNGFKGKRTP